MGYKIVETLSSSGVISGIDPPPSPFSSIQSWSVCCILEVAQTVVKQCMKTGGVGGRESSSFSPFEASKKSERRNGLFQRDFYGVIRA